MKYMLENIYLYILIIILIIMKSIKKEIEETEKRLKELKEKLKRETNNSSEWIHIPELKIEVQTKIHHKNKIYSECEKDLSKGESIPTYEQIQWLRNSKYKDQLNLDDSWEFVQNPDNISKKNNYVAGFYADSGYADLYCDRYSGDSDSVLGVRFVRKKISKKSKLNVYMNGEPIVN